MSHPSASHSAGLAGRRDFLKGAALAGGASLLPAGLPAATAAPAGLGDARPLTDAEKATRLASNTYPIRNLFKRRAAGAGTMGANAERQAQAAAEMKKKYGEITLLDFPQFTLDRFPGVRKMDLWSSLFGDVTSDAMYVKTSVTRDGRTILTRVVWSHITPRSARWEQSSSADGGKTWEANWTSEFARRA